MKNLFFVVIALSLVLFGCESSSDIQFDKPLPIEKDKLEQIPSKLIGTYTTVSDTTLLISFKEDFEYDKQDSSTILNLTNRITVSEKTILNNISGELIFKLTYDSGKKEIKSISETKNKIESEIDSLITASFHRVDYEYKLESQADSTLTYHLNLQDTLFFMSEKNLIISYKKDYYLNLQSENRLWSVYQLKQTKDKELVLNSISNQDENVLHRIIKLNHEFIPHKNAPPSLKSFKKFLKMNGFENKIKLNKVN